MFPRLCVDKSAGEAKNTNASPNNISGTDEPLSLFLNSGHQLCNRLRVVFSLNFYCLGLRA